MDLNRLIAEFSQQLARGRGAVFAGSGLSVLSGLPDWLGLIQNLAADLGITVTKDDNLPLIAQFIVNGHGGNRGILLRHLREAIGRPLAPNQYHAALSAMNVSTVWTTNYDTLLEDSLSGFFVRATDAHIAHPGLGGTGEIIKIHGCVRQSGPDEIVITSEDYEDFFARRPATARRLEIDLVEHPFLFVGYGYGDPNVANIMITARRLAQRDIGHHYMIQKRLDDPEKRCRQELWVCDLKRIGISCALADSYTEIETAFAQIAQKSRGQTVFVTGRHTDSNPIAEELGPLLADIASLTVLDGQSTGIGRTFISAYSEACLNTQQDMIERLRIFPNPYAIRREFEMIPLYSRS